jgi:hypothetical protein
MQPIEAVLSVGMAALATAIAMGSLRVPTELTQSSIMLALFKIVALVLFSYSPVVGIAAIALFAVTVFSRNLQTVVNVNSAGAYGNHHRKTNPVPPVYGEHNIYKERHDIQAYDDMASQPREYSNFRDTSRRSLLSSVEGFEAAPAPYNYVNEAADGQYPINQNRVTASPAREEYMYEPEADTGSNEFERYGPSLDEKLQSFGY